MNMQEKFVVDASGRRTAVLVEIDRYEILIDAEEELASIRAYDSAKASGDEAISFETAVEEIENSHR